MRLVLILFLFPILSHGQSKTDYSDIIPKDLAVKQLIDTANYIENSLRVSIIDYLKSKKFDLTKYFVASPTSIVGDTLCIALYHLDGLKRLKTFEKEKEENVPISGVIALGIAGNPGNCGTIYYNLKSKEILGFYFWQ